MKTRIIKLATGTGKELEAKAYYVDTWRHEDMSIDLYAHKVESGDYWTVTEYSTGHNMGIFTDTRKEAIYQVGKLPAKYGLDTIMEQVKLLNSKGFTLNS